MARLRKYLPNDKKQDVYNFVLINQRQNDIISMLLDGKDRKEINAYLVNKYDITPQSATVYISDATRTIKERRNFEIDNLITIHIARYEDLYNRLVSINAHRMSLDALKGKEKLMRFHDNGFHMRVTQGQVSQLSFVNINNEYDVDKLSEDKRKRLDELLLKAKRKKVT